MPELDEVTVYGSNKWSDLKPLDLNDEDLVMVDWDRYYKEEYEKSQIVLHHTVSGPGTRGDLVTWKKYKSNIATCIIIERDGTIKQLFSSRYWGFHLGAGKSSLDRHSIAIELDNWGGLTKKDDGFYATYGNKVNVPVTEYEEEWRGYKYYESYTYEQLRAVGELLLLWNKNYNIPLSYNEDMWDVSHRALNGTPGIWTHVSYRKPSDKQDCHPDPELKSLLRTLSSLV
jgi:N-acetyl-anhydromuramyl-L-alanine amidase AmpD